MKLDVSTIVNFTIAVILGTIIGKLLSDVIDDKMDENDEDLEMYDED